MVKRIVRKQINRNLETKFLCTQSVAVGVNTTPNFTTILVPALGNTENERIGDTITLKSLYYNYSVQYEDSTNVFRIIIFQWMQDSSLNAPIVNSILEQSSATTQDYVYSPYSMNNAQNYRILYDRTHLVQQQGTQIVHRKGYITKFPNRKIVFTNASGGSVSNIKRGQIYVLTMSDSSVAPHPDWNATFKLNYTDA